MKIQVSRPRPLVLIADDDRSMLLLLRAALEQVNFEVLEVTDGSQAVESFRRYRPDMVLLDVLMPGLDGFETCAALRGLPGGSYVPIVMVTVMEDIDSINRAYELGATDFITKPINWGLLGHRVRYLLRANQEFILRKKLEEQLHRSQKMEAIGRLAGGVAHDFNNILTAITGYSDILMSGLAEDDPLREDLEEIKRASERATSLTRQLLAFCRMEAQQQRVINLNDVVADLGKMLQRLIGENIDLATDLDPGLGTVKADPEQMEQLLMNLVINARDAMPQGGVLSIDTANVWLDENFTKQHVNLHPGPYVTLSISDTGIGMDGETQARIFEPFFTTKECGKGTGLGLSMVYGIVKQSQGHIEVSSESGGGSTFRIYLPVSNGPVKEPKVSPAPARDVCHRGTETILLVEDDQIVRQVTRKMLQHRGYQVLEAGTPGEALEIKEQHPGPIHLLLTDLVLPGMTGKDLAAHWASLTPQTKVLFMSGYAEDVALHGQTGEGATFIQKPFKIDTLTAAVRQVLDGPAASPAGTAIEA